MISMQDIPANIEKAAGTASDRLRTARDNIGSVVYGQDKVVELAIAAILSGGHALLVLSLIHISEPTRPY